MTWLLSLEKVSFAYGGGPKPALDQVDFHIGPGEFVGLAGHLGAGKSTLIRAATGLAPKLLKGRFSGRVLVKGESIERRRVADLAGTIGTVFQDFENQIFSTNVRRELAFGLENLGLDRRIMLERIARTAELTGLSDLMDREPQSLSGGQKQRLALASVLCLQPDLLLGDEPTTDLDPLGRRQVGQVLDRLVKSGHGVGLVDQDVDRLLDADRLVVLESGRVAAQGPPAEVLADPSFCLDHGLFPPPLFDLFARLGLAERPRRAEAAKAVLDRHGFRLKPEQTLSLEPEPSGPVLIAADGVSFSYPDSPPALTRLALEIKAGEFLALLGANGSGKTTLVKLFNALLKPSSGRVLFQGRDTAGLSPAEMGRHVGFVFQNPDQMLFAATVRDEVSFGLKNFGLPAGEIETRAAEALATVRLSGRESEDPFTLTRGERQKLAVASVLAYRPEVLVLDEPTTGLDAAEQTAMMELLVRLNRSGHTIIIITHAVDLASAYARRLVLLESGRLAGDGPPARILARDDLLAQAGLVAPENFRLGLMYGRPALTPAELAGSLTREPE
ncbi:MAG: energy-coupling factor transporter ATPase [Thermodesulfobacteriota bacterium]